MAIVLIDPYTTFQLNFYPHLFWYQIALKKVWLGCLSGPPGFTCCISFALVFNFIYCWVLKLWSFMQTKYLCVLIHIWIKAEVGAVKQFKSSSKIFYWPFQGDTSFVDLFMLFLSCVCYAFVCVCLFVPCGHLLEKGWPLDFRLWCITVSLSLSHWYPGSGVVLDCIYSWSLHPYLLCTLTNTVSQFFSDIVHAECLGICDFEFCGLVLVQNSKCYENIIVPLRVSWHGLTDMIIRTIEKKFITVTKNFCFRNGNVFFFFFHFIWEVYNDH